MSEHKPKDQAESAIEAQERAKTERVTTIEFVDFETSMQQLIDLACEFAPYPRTGSNAVNYPPVSAKIIKLMFEEVMNPESPLSHKLGYHIPTKYGIRNKMSDIFRSAYKQEFNEDVALAFSPDEYDEWLNKITTDEQEKRA